MPRSSDIGRISAFGDPSADQFSVTPILSMIEVVECPGVNGTTTTRPPQLSTSFAPQS
jgi:hypothetical protein